MFSSLLFFLLSIISTNAFSMEIDLPVETALYRSSDLPGYQLVQKNCIACHSPQYVLTQPPSSPRAYWQATVHKMKNAFGAPIAEEEIPVMVDYLVKVYGNESGMSKKMKKQLVR